MPKEFEVNGQKVVFEDDVPDYDIRLALTKMADEAEAKWQTERESEGPLIRDIRDREFARQRSQINLIGARSPDLLTPEEKGIVQAHQQMFREKRDRLEKLALESESPDTWNVFQSTMMGREKEKYDPSGVRAKGLRIMAKDFDEEAWRRNYGGMSVQEIARMAKDVETDYKMQERALPPTWVAMTSAFGRGLLNFVNQQVGSDPEIESEFARRTRLPSVGFFESSLESGLEGAGWASGILAELAVSKGLLAGLGKAKKLAMLGKIANAVDKSRHLNTLGFSAIAASAAQEGEGAKTFVSTAAQAYLGMPIEKLIGKIPLWKKLPKFMRPSYDTEGNLMPSVMNQALISGTGNVVADLATFWDPTIDEKTGQGWVGRDITARGLGSSFVMGAFMGGKGEIERTREENRQQAEKKVKEKEAADLAERVKIARQMAMNISYEEARKKMAEAQAERDRQAQIFMENHRQHVDEMKEAQAAAEFNAVKTWLQSKIGGEVDDADVAAYIADIRSRESAARIVDEQRAAEPNRLVLNQETGMPETTRPDREKEIDDLFYERNRALDAMLTPEGEAELDAELRSYDRENQIGGENFRIDPNTKFSGSDIKALDGELDILQDNRNPDNDNALRRLRRALNTARGYIDARLEDIGATEGDLPDNLREEARRLEINKVHLDRWGRRVDNILNIREEARYASPERLKQQGRVSQRGKVDEGRVPAEAGRGDRAVTGATEEGQGKGPRAVSEVEKSVNDLVKEGTTLSWARNVLRQAAGKLREAGRLEDSIRATALADSSEVDEVFGKRTPEANSQILSDLITKADEYAREFGLSRQKPGEDDGGKGDGGEGEAEGGLGARRPKGPNVPKAPKGQVKPKGGVAGEPASGKVTAKGGENERVGEEYTIENNGIDGVVIDHRRAPSGTPDREYVFGRVIKDGPLAIWSRDILDSDAGPKTKWTWGGVPEVLKRLKGSKPSRGIGGARAQNRPAGESFIRDYAGDSFVRDFMEEDAFGRALNILTTRGFTLPEYLLEDVKRPSIWDNLSEDQREFIKKALELGTYDRAMLAENELARRAVEWGKSRGKAGESGREDASKPGGVGRAKRGKAPESKTEPGPEVIPPKSGLYDWKEVKGKMTEAERLRQAREHIERVEKVFSTAENLPGGMQSVDYEDFVAIRPKSRASMANEAPYVSISTIFKNADGTWTAHVGVIFDNWGDGWPSIKGKTRSEVIAQSAARIKQLIADNSGKIRTKAEKARMEVVLSWADGLINKYGRGPQSAETGPKTLKEIGGIGGGIRSGMYDMLWAKVQNGETTEGGNKSALLQAAKMIRDAGGLKTRDQFVALAADYSRVSRGPNFKRDMLDLVKKYTPAKEGGAVGEAQRPEVRPPVDRESLESGKWLPMGTRIKTSIPRAPTLAKRIYDKYLKDRYRGPEMAHSILKAVEDDGLYTNGFFAVKLLPNEAEAIAAEMRKRGMSSEGAKPLPVKNELGGSPVHGKARLISSKLAAKGSSDPDIYVYEGEDGTRLAFDASVVEEILHRYPDAKLFLGKDRMFFESGTGADKRVAVLMHRAYADISGLPPSGPVFSRLSRPLNELLSDNLLTQLKSWQPKGTVDQLKKHLMKARGAKDQMYWTGLDKFLEGKETVTREEVEKFVRENQVKMDIVELTGEDARYGTWSTPTKDNDGYFELLFEMQPPPIDKQFSFFGTHFKDSNVIAHARAKIITDSLGRRILHIDEIQSDLHQAARDKGGYRDVEKDKARKIEIKLELEGIDREISKIDDEMLAAYQRIDGSSESPWGNFVNFGKFKAYADSHPDLKSLVERQEGLWKKQTLLLNEMEGIDAKPRQAPFETAEKQAELVAKTMIRLASERGLDGISLAKGIDQLDRYGTSIIAWDSMFADKSSTAKDKYVEIRLKSGAMSDNILYGVRRGGESRVATSVGEVLSENNARRILSTTPQDQVLIVRSEPELHKHLLTDGGLGHYSPERLKSLSKRLWERMQVERAGVSAPRLEGMAGTYDKTYLNTISNVLQKFGVSQETITYPEARLDRKDMPAWIFNDKLRESAGSSMTLFSRVGGVYVNRLEEMKAVHKERVAKQTGPIADHVREIVNLVANGDLKWEWARDLPADSQSMLATIFPKIGQDLDITQVRSLIQEAINSAGEGNVTPETLRQLKLLDAVIVAQPRETIVRFVTGNIMTDITTTAGMYSPDLDAIEISLPFVLRTSPDASLAVRSVTHEYVHAQTIEAIRSIPEINAKFTDLYRQAMRYAEEALKSGEMAIGDFGPVDPTNQYGLFNVEEFVAEAISSPKFAEFLNRIPADYEDVPSLAEDLSEPRRGLGKAVKIVKTLYDKFVSAVKSALRGFGIKIDDESVLREVLDAYALVAPMSTEGMPFAKNGLRMTVDRAMLGYNEFSAEGHFFKETGKKIRDKILGQRGAGEEGRPSSPSGPLFMRTGDVTAAVKESAPVRVTEEASLSILSWTKKMANRLSQFGGEYGKNLGDKFLSAGNYMRIARGRLSDKYEAVLEAVGATSRVRDVLGRGLGGQIGRQFSKKAEARMNMTELKREGDYARMPKWVLAAEGKNVGPLSAEERAMVESVRALARANANMFIEAGVLRFDKSKGKYVPLSEIYGSLDLPESELGKVVRRMPTLETMDILAAGPQHRRHWKKFVEAWQAVNPDMNPADVENILMDAHVAFTEEPTGRMSFEPSERRAAIEQFRGLKEAPAAIYDGNTRVDLFETDIARWAAGYVIHNSTRMGVIKAFGQNISYDPETMKPTKDPLPYFKMRKQYVESGGQGYIFDQTMRAMQGQSVVQPTVDTQEIRRFTQPIINFINHGVKGLKVSASFLYNPLEPWSTAREQAGWAEVAQAYGEGISAGLYRLTNGKFGSADSFEIFKNLERMGAMETQPGVFMNVSTQRFVEGVAARAMQLRAGKMAGRKGVASSPEQIRRDVLRLKQMGYDDAMAMKLASGEGTKFEYDSLVRLAAPQATGAGLSGAERTRFEQSPAWRALFPIMNFAVRHVSQISRTMKTIFEEVEKSGRIDPKTGKMVFDAKKAAEAAKFLVETAGTRAAHGMAQNILRAALIAGVPGLMAAWSKLKDEPVEAAWRGLVENVFGQSGPLASMYTATVQENRSITDAIFPLAVARELSNFFTNDGRYEDLEWWDHISEAGKWLFPLARVAMDGIPNLISVGVLGNENQTDAIRQARRVFYQWREEEKIPYMVHEAKNATEEDKARYDAMRKARRAIMDRDDPDKIVGYLEKAFNATGGKSLKSAIESSRLLKGLDQKHLDDLKAEIGLKNYRILEAEDKLLEELGATISTSKRSTGAPFPKERMRDIINRGIGRGR